VSSAEPRFYDSFTAEAHAAPGGFVVYGIRLAPFNLRHALILEQLENPGWIGGTITPELLIAAAAVCAFADASGELPAADLTAEMIAAHDFNAEINAWENYLAQCNSSPRTKRFEGSGKSLHAPVEMIVAVYLMRQLGMTEERAWTMPRGLANWYFEAAREQETGESGIIEEAEWQEMEAALGAEQMAADAARCKRMEKLMRRKAERLARCKTPKAARKVEKWFIEQLRTFDLEPKA